MGICLEWREMGERIGEGWLEYTDYFFFMSDYLEGKTIDVEYLGCPWSQSGR